MNVDRFLLEYDTERTGTFEPLRFVPDDKMVVLGLISSKTPELESQDELRRRIGYVKHHSLLEDPSIWRKGNAVTVVDVFRNTDSRTFHDEMTRLVF